MPHLLVPGNVPPSAPPTVRHQQHHGLAEQAHVVATRHQEAAHLRVPCHIVSRQECGGVGRFEWEGGGMALLAEPARQAC